MTVARDGLAARPPVPPPPALAPVLRFRRLPPAALATVSLVLERDDDFRARVAASTTEAEVGRAAIVWLRREPGWAEDFARYLDDGDDGSGNGSEDGIGDDGSGNGPWDGSGGPASGADDLARLDRRQLVRRLAGAQRAASRTAARIAERDREATNLATQTRDAQSARRAADRDRDRLRREVERLTAAHDGLAAALAAAELALVRRGEERRRLRDRIEELEASGDAAQLRRDTLEGGRVARALAASLREGAGDADALAARLEARLERRPRNRGAGQAGRGPRRSPLGLPGGLLDTSGDAARWLVSRPGAVVLVDGYNATIGRWGDEPLASQRDRLVGVLGVLAARHPGLEVHVVFDGADVVAPPVAHSAPRGVQVRFTEADTEADDELVAFVDRFPPHRPVVVVSDDRRVRDGTRASGGNVLGVDQLLAVAG